MARIKRAALYTMRVGEVRLKGQNEVVSGSKRSLKGGCKGRGQSHLKTYEWQSLVQAVLRGGIDAGELLVEIGQASGTKNAAGRFRSRSQFGVLV